MNREKVEQAVRIGMVITLLITFIIIVLTKTVYAEPVNGHDYLAAQQSRFKTELAAKYLTRNEATGNLDWTFGTSLEPIRTLLTTKPKYHRTHFFNGPCIRGGNCGPYEITRGYTVASFDKAISKKTPKLLNFFKTRVALYRDLCSAFPATQCLVSPELEHQLSKKSYRILSDAAREVWPGVQLVNSPMGGISIERYLGSWIERHGFKPQSDADIVSSDGQGVTDGDVVAFVKRTNTARMKIRYEWERVDNCRDNGPFKDPRKRTACPTGPQFEELIHIFDDRGVAPKGIVPAGCSKVIPFTSPRIFKPFADDHGNGDKRANMPVVLIKTKGPHLSVLAYNGTKVGQIGLYRDAAPHSQERYYSNWGAGSGLQGYQFEKKVKAASGSPWTWLKVNSICTGPIIPGRRNGLMKY